MNENPRMALLGCVQLVGCVLLLVLTAVLGGTFRTEVTYLPAGEAPDTDNSAFEENVTVAHWLGGLVKGESLQLDQLIERHTRQGEHVTRIAIVTKHTATNLLVSFVTAGIYTPETITIRGSIGRTREAAAQ
jgi:hypothetical protein